MGFFAYQRLRRSSISDVVARAHASATSSLIVFIAGDGRLARGALWALGIGGGAFRRDPLQCLGAGPGRAGPDSHCEGRAERLR